jgi:hypothetical protein
LRKTTPGRGTEHDGGQIPHSREGEKRKSADQNSAGR